jgi:signal transduction histidine kinase
MTEPDKPDGTTNSEVASQDRHRADQAGEHSAVDQAMDQAGPPPGDEKSALATEYEAKINEVADLITRVRHEINNPLTGVLGQAQLLLREELSDKARKRAKTIEELAIRLRDIVGQLRQVQRVSRS